MEEQIDFKKKFFDLLSFIKYVLESKVVVPFSEKESRQPFKKPLGYALYSSKQDEFDYLNSEPDLMNEIESRAKRYHYLRSKFTKIVRGLIFIENIRGGQHTISFKLFDALVRSLRSHGVFVSYDKIHSVYVLPKSLRRSMLNKDPVRLSFFNKLKRLFKNFFDKPTMSDLYRVTFSDKDLKKSFSITAYVYYVDRRVSLISFLEYGLKTENHAGDILKKMSIGIDNIIRRLPIIDIID